MDAATVGMLLAAGVAGGALSALVGGASLVLFPAMLAAGLPPVVAVASNTTAITPGNFLAALADRSQLPRFDRAFYLLVAVSLLAAGAGAVLLMLTPERLFELLVPLLLAFGTLLFAYAAPIGAFLGQLSFGRSRTTLHPNAVGIAMMLPVSLYGGYFGAGVGVLLIAALSVANGGDYRSANVTKNFVGSLNNLVAAVVFASQGMIAWPPVLIVGGGAVAGALAGARLARILPAAAARRMVIGFGMLLTGIYAWRYWL
jgi:uncharacterized membrane protein YfcA